MAVVYRIDAGGDGAAGTPAWEADSAASPSQYSNFDEGGNSATTVVGATIDVTHASIPAGTPMSLFQTERFDKPAGTNLLWDFPVAPGQYEVRLYFAETFSGAFANGVRVFDVAIEGATVLDNYDIFADIGAGNKGIVKSFTVTSDANLDIDFMRGLQNPTIKAIEILTIETNTLYPSATSFEFGNVVLNQTATQQLTLTNDNAAGGANITINPASAFLTPGATPFSFSFAQATPIVLAPGQSTIVTLNYTPTSAASNSATLTIPHNGNGSPVVVSLSGAGVVQLPISFTKSLLEGTTTLSRPTSVQFGPDGRLYVSQQNGLINVYTVVKNGANDYDVTATETISLIQQIPNHNDDGVLNSAVTERLVTGLLVAGTAQNPVIYVGSSDPRIGGGNSGNDTNLDTNSSILSRLTWNGSAWVKLDLVRGLPRSDEQHALNGMQLDTATNTLYLTVGGNTNMGAPSNNFAFLPEYAYSAAILSIDLDAIGNTTYDIPTLDDEDRPGVNDANDPFGGNNGKNQARIVPGGPVQIFAPGFRNPYDLVITASGRFYTVDNGPNAGWGEVPVNEGPGGNATNAPNEPGLTYGDGLHFITGAGYYGGHPNPTRSNPSNTFNTTNPQSPVTSANPIESDYQIPGVENGALEVYAESTNGLTEYRATNFNGAMQGDLLIASFDNTIKRVKLSADGTQIVLSENLFTNVGFRPLDVISPATGPFAGSIWVVDVALGTVTVFEPSDGGGGSENDLDGDGYSNDDEIANGTNPNSPADVPPDYDLDFLSNLLDPDDDNDTLNDQVDKFAVDGDNGATTPVGTFYTWENEGENLGGILGMGFTGMMTDGTSNYESLYDPEGVTAGGAAGVFTIDTATTGTARGATNTQEQAFQFGVDVGDEVLPFIVQTRVLGAFNGLTPQAGQEMGVYIGTGDQDNYIQLVLSGTGGGSIQTLSEINGVATPLASQALALPGPGAVDLWLYIDPVANTLQAMYSTDGTTFIDLGGPVAVPAAWLASTLAVGLISTNPAGTAMPVTWDQLGVVSDTTAGEASAKVELFPGGSITNSSTARVDSFRIHNTSTAGKQIQSVTFDLSTTAIPDLLFDPNGTAGDVAGVPFVPNSGGTETGQSTHSFLSPRDGGFDQLQVNFTDFDPGETFTFRTDVDPTSVKGSAQPGPSNAADISGLELTGATVTIHFDDGAQLTGQLFALDEGASFYLVHSEVTLTETPVTPAPQVSLLGVTTPSIVTSAAQTIRVTGPVGATVRLMQNEIALHLANVPNGGFDIDPYEANKIVSMTDVVAVIGAGGFVDIPVTLRDTLTEGGINYFTAVIDNPDGTTSAVSNTVKVALNDLPPGSNPGAVLSIAPDSASKAEGNSGTTAFTFTVTRSGSTSGTTTVNYAVTGSGTNVASAADFGGTFPSGVVTFTDGQSTQTITINVSGDTSVEPDEGFTVTLSNASAGASIGTTNATGSILNDDASPASLAIAADSASKNEGNTGTTAFTFIVTRSGNTSGMTTVNYAVTGSGANAANAADFGGTFPGGVVTFANGETTQTITINVSGDSTVEPDDGFTVTLSNASGGAQIATATATGSILNDDSEVGQAGLIGEYFNTTNLTGTIATTRVDGTVNFPTDWGAAPAGTAVTADDNYSVRWTGFVEASTAGSWTFFTTSNDGVRLFIDDVQIINNFTTHAVTENSGTISLTAGWHSVRLEFFQQGGVAEITLSFQGPGQTKSIIPTNKLRTTNPGGGQLLQSAPLTGDYDFSSTVDQADYQVWRDQYGDTGTGLAADGNADGTVDALDFTVWRNNFGATRPDFSAQQALTAATAPEDDLDVEVVAESLLVPLRTYVSPDFGFVSDSSVPGPSLVLEQSTASEPAVRERALELITAILADAHGQNVDAASEDFGVLSVKSDCLDGDAENAAWEQAFAAFDKGVADITLL
jgi:hypothetical protein